MTEGSVTTEYEAVVPVLLHDTDGHDHAVKAIVDTGFTGWLTLPPDIIHSLRLPWREWCAAILADGSRSSFDVFTASVTWNGRPLTIPVAEVDADPLIGMRLMRGCRITIDDVDGGAVKIERL